MAHLVCATQAAEQLGLDRVLLMPVSTPPHKECLDEPGPEVRLELCRLAAAGDERLDVSRLEIDRGGPSYTVDTLRELHEQAPEDDLTFIIGGDMALGLPSWREPEEVLELARIAVAGRPGAARRNIVERLCEVFDDPPVAFFDMPQMDLSSSDIRRRAAEGRTIRYLVPDAVAERIEQSGLYG